MSLLKSFYGAFASTLVLEDMGTDSKVIYNLFMEKGLSVQDVEEILDFTEETISSSGEDREEIQNMAMGELVDNMLKLKKYMEMARGYQEMGEINQTTANEDFHLESEVEALNEMDKKNTQATA